MESDSEIFYSPETSFHEEVNHDLPKSHDSEERKNLESKNSNHSSGAPKLMIHHSLRPKETISGLKAVPVFPKFEVIPP